jgi:2-methylcitrate dehydratase PrpD
MTAETLSVTHQLAEWIVGSRYEDIPEIGICRAKERFIDSFGVQLGGMATSTGRILATWVKAQDARPISTVVGAGFKTSPSLAALANGASGHALEYDDVAASGGHPANPLTAAALAVGENADASGRAALHAWMVGWEVIAQTNKPCRDGPRNTLMSRGWFNQGFQPTLGVAALTAKLRGLDVKQTRMALGNAAAAMAGVMKNRASDTKAFIAGNAAMHGVMAAELAAMGFTANEDILDGADGVARMMGQEVGDPQRVLDGLGAWDLANNRGTIKMFASCAAGHWAQEAMRRIVLRRPFASHEVERIVVHQPSFLMESLPFHRPKTGLQGKYSLEYDLIAVALDGRAGMKAYTDEAVQRPAAQQLMERVEYVPVEVDLANRKFEARVAVTLTSGEIVEESADTFSGSAQAPPTDQELVAKFYECAKQLMPETRCDEAIDLCWRLDKLDSVRRLGAAIS